MPDEIKYLEEPAWQLFAEVYPHEAYAQWPDRFWAFFHAKYPKVTRNQMERILWETDEA